MRILLFPASRNRNSVRNSVTVNNDVLNKEHCSEKKRSLSHLSSKIHIHTYIHTQVDFSFLFIPNRSVHDRPEGRKSVCNVIIAVSLSLQSGNNTRFIAFSHSFYVRRANRLNTLIRAHRLPREIGCLFFFFFFFFFVPVFPLVLQHYRRRHATHAHARLTRTIYTNTREISLPLTYIYIYIYNYHIWSESLCNGYKLQIIYLR